MGKTNNYQIAGSIEITTTGNIDNLDVKGYALIRMNNASLSTIRGIREGYPGQKLTFVSVGAGQVNFAHQDTNSSAANRLINFVTSGITPLAAGKGTATYQYDDTTARWRLVEHIQGAFIDIPFSAGNFTASAGNWTLTSPDQVTFGYYLKGNELTLILTVIFSTVSASPTSLIVTIPNSWTSANINRGSILYLDGGVTTGNGLFSMTVGGTTISFFRDIIGATAWTTIVDGTFIYFNNVIFLN